MTGTGNLCRWSLIKRLNRFIFLELFYPVWRTTHAPHTLVGIQNVSGIVPSYGFHGRCTTFWSATCRHTEKLKHFFYCWAVTTVIPSWNLLHKERYLLHFEKMITPMRLRFLASSFIIGNSFVFPTGVQCEGQDLKAFSPKVELEMHLMQTNEINVYHSND